MHFALNSPTGGRGGVGLSRSHYRTMCSFPEGRALAGVQHTFRNTPTTPCRARTIRFILAMVELPLYPRKILGTLMTVPRYHFNLSGRT